MRHFPTFLCAAVAGLVALGLVMLASTSAWVRGVEAPYHFLVRQAVMVGVGLVFAVVAAKVPLGWYRKLSALGFVVACVLLALCFVPGINVEIFGSKRWIQLGPLPQFQPSEMAKIVVVLCLATWFARWQTEVHTFWRGFVIPGLIAAVPVGLIAAETDVGTALSLSVAVGAIMFCVGTRLRYLVP
ncbi:MAG: FtsW/RodA/SpoVE family cell cycle protein, partial [Verrucomicrobiales bacterium]